MNNTWTGNNRIFRTYLKGGGKDGKRCVDRHKGISQVRTFEDASQFANFGAVCNEGYIDISFDDAEMSEAFLNMAEQNQWRCMCLENPVNHHLHTYWKDTAHRITKFNKDLNLACGLVADIHGGETYIPLKVNGVDRFPPVYDIYEDEEYQEVPEELIPVQTNIKLWKSKEGDGRNSDLYGYILILQSQLQMSDDRIRELYKECINRFILGDKMSDAELDVILRDESFQKQIIPSFWSGASFLHDKFAEYLIQTDHIIRVDGQLHIFNDGSFTNDLDVITATMRGYVPKLKKSQKAEVLDYLSDMAPVRKEAEARFIAFKNGVLDVVTGELHEPSPDHVVSNIIPWNYDPAAYNELTDRTLNKISCNDPRIRKLLEECCGYCFYRDNSYNRAFILIGDKANGKSTFLKVLIALLGEKNVSSLDLKNLGDRFSKASLYKKLANIGDDISDDFIPDTSLFKKITDGGRIEAENKGQKPFDFSPYAKLIFSANDIPRMKDKTGAVMRRLVIIPFNAKFSPSDPDFDPDIKSKLAEQSSMEYLVRIGVEGLKRIIQQKDFTQSDKVDAEREQYNLENNPVLAFLADQDKEQIINQATGEVYRKYQVFCQENGYQAVSNISFSKQINRELGTHTEIRHLGKGSSRKTFKTFVR